MKIFYTKGRMLLTFILAMVTAGSFARTCVPPTLSTSSTDITCHGAHNGSAGVTVTSTVVPPLTFYWTGPGGFSSPSQFISGLDSGMYYVTVMDGTGCQNYASVLVTQPPALQAVPSSNAPFCPGGDLVLYSGTSGGVPPYMYSWTGPNSFTSTDTDPAIPAATSAVNGVYSLTVTDGHLCTTTANFSVLLYPEPVVNLGDDTGYICGGTPVPLDAGNVGSSYQWNTGAVSQVIVATTVGEYSVAVTNMYSCVGTDSIYIASSPNVVPTVSLDPFTNNVCAGTPVTFHANPTYPGHTPSYIWRKNGIVVSGATSDTYTDAALNNGDYITTRLTSSFACAVPATAYSDTAHMTIVANVPASVTISHLPDTACSGTPITFTATPVNGGLTPYYEWMVGNTVVGTGNTYIYAPTTTQTVTVNMVSSIECHLPDTASAVDSFVIYPHLIPNAHVTFTPNDTVAYLGQIVTFFCEVTYGGSSPTYQWYVNRVAVSGATNSTFAPHVYLNDTVKCVVVSNDVCAIPRRDTSNTVIIYASFLDVNGVNANKTDISIFPNPTVGDFTLSGTIGILSSDEVAIEVRDLKGSTVFRKNTTARNGVLNEPLSLSRELAEGMYFVVVRSDASEKQLKLIINK